MELVLGRLPYLGDFFSYKEGRCESCASGGMRTNQTCQRKGGETRAAKQQEIDLFLFSCVISPPFTSIILTLQNRTS